MPADTRLDQALALLRGDGEPRWTKEIFHRRVNGVTMYCVVGAMEKVRQGASWQSKDELYADKQAVKAVINEQFPSTVTHGIFSFNDVPERTFEDIEMVLEKAYIQRVEEV